MPPPTCRLLTPPGEGGIAVIELAGEGADALLSRLFASPLPADGIARGWLREDGRRLDEALVWRGEGTIEIGLHGGSVPAAAVLRALRRGGARELTEAPTTGDPIRDEAAALLPSAATLPAAMFLAAAAEGALSREMSSGDPNRLRALLDRAAEGFALAHPRTVVIAGPPNAGKSTLLNALSGRDRALVHETAGTTRDPVEALADVGGYPIRFVDTAGLTGRARGVDALAEEAAARAAKEAALVLWLADPAGPASPPGALSLSAKSDLGPVRPGALPVSGLTGAGLDALRQAILTALGLPFPAGAKPAPFTEAQVERIRRQLGGR